MAWAGFSCPGAITPVYDTLAAAWMGSAERPSIPDDLAEAPLEPSFWNAFWSVILAQFGHNYSAMFLASVTTITHVMQPAGFPILMQLIAEAWRHGRRAPALMDIEWEREWNDSIATIRARHSIPVYQSALPADLLESLQAGAA